MLRTFLWTFRTNFGNRLNPKYFLGNYIKTQVRSIWRKRIYKIALRLEIFFPMLYTSSGIFVICLVFLGSKLAFYLDTFT